MKQRSWMDTHMRPRGMREREWSKERISLHQVVTVSSNLINGFGKWVQTQEIASQRQREASAWLTGSPWLYRLLRGCHTKSTCVPSRHPVSHEHVVCTRSSWWCNEGRVLLRKGRKVDSITSWPLLVSTNQGLFKSSPSSFDLWQALPAPNPLSSTSAVGPGPSSHVRTPFTSSVIQTEIRHGA